MPDDFDYSQPVSRNRIIDPSTPVLTMALIALCCIITAAYLLVPTDNGSPLYKLGHFAVLRPEQIWDGRYLALFTSFFVHLSILHIAFNMLWLWRLGVVLEMTVALWKYVLFLVSATMVGSCCELLLSGQTGAGASGAGYALIGLLWGGRGFHESWGRLATKENMGTFLVWGVLCIFFTFTKTMPVANGAHFGGLLFGVAVGKFFFAPRRQAVWSVALVFLLGVCVLSLTWLPWSSTWNWYKGSQAYDRQHYQEAIAYYERGLRTTDDRQGLLSNIGLSWLRIADEAIAKKQPEAAGIALKKSEEALAAANALPAPSRNSEDSSDGSAQSVHEDFQDQSKRKIRSAK